MTKPDTCDTCGQSWHDKTDHEPKHTYTPQELLSFGTEVVEFHLNGTCCGVKSEVTLTDLKATVRFCPVCGYESGKSAFEHDDLCFSNPEMACDICKPRSNKAESSSQSKEN